MFERQLIFCCSALKFVFMILSFILEESQEMKGSKFIFDESNQKGMVIHYKFTVFLNSLLIFFFCFAI